MNTFIKRNCSPFSDTLIKESQGLELLRKQVAASRIGELNVPKVFTVSESELELTHIVSEPPIKNSTRNQMAELGRGLAELHLIEQLKYGLDDDNYIGLNRQINGLCDDWGDFFVSKRLGYQISLIGSQLIKNEFESALDKAGDSLRQFLNASVPYPSLVHGDLWSGNVLFDKTRVWLIDPAVYYGDREVDLAMTEMFGGVTLDFYQAYDEVFPRSKEYSVKKVIYNLYHYLNHYNLFGESYLGGCREGFEFIRSRFG